MPVVSNRNRGSEDVPMFGNLFGDRTVMAEGDDPEARVLKC